jgi:hypothetical protein
MFGEDDCLLMVVNQGEIEGPRKPTDLFYSVTCDSVDSEVYFAEVEDVWKIFANEKKIM